MFCHKCGTEIIAEDANYCFNCQEPLLKIPAANSQNPSAGPGYLNDEKEDPTDNVNLEFGDDENALRVSDPIDFLMNEEPEDQPLPEPPKPQELSPMADTPADEPPNEPFSPPPVSEYESDSRQYGDIDQADPSQSDTIGEPAPEITDQDQQSPPPANMENDSATKGYDIENQPAEPDTTDMDETTDASGNIENEPIPEDNYIENQPIPEDNDIENQPVPEDNNIEEQPTPENNSTEDQPVAPEDNTVGETTTSVGYTVNEFPPQGNNIENRPVSSERNTDEGPPESTTNIESQQTKPVERVESRAAPERTTVAPSSTPSFSNSQSFAGGGGQQVATMKKPAVQNQAPAQSNIRMNTDPNQGENIIATSKIKVEEKSKAAGRTSSGAPATSRIKDVKTVSDPSSLDLNKIKRSSRIAYLTGNTISFTGGPKISAGDQITVGKNSYEVRLRSKDKLNKYGLIGSIVVAIIVTLYFLGAFNSSPDGSLVGLVLGPGNRPLADREVRLKESGDKVKTNSAGFFIFDSIPVGIYTVQYIENGDVIGEDRITVLSGKTSTMKLERSSRIGMAAPMRRPDTNSQQIATKTESIPEPQPVKKKTLAL